LTRSKSLHGNILDYVAKKPRRYYAVGFFVIFIIRRRCRDGSGRCQFGKALEGHEVTVRVTWTPSNNAAPSHRVSWHHQRG
jgi:hypothetical protein